MARKARKTQVKTLDEMTLDELRAAQQGLLDSFQHDLLPEVAKVVAEQIARVQQALVSRRRNN
jgi:hypothetical protein